MGMSLEKIFIVVMILISCNGQGVEGRLQHSEDKLVAVMQDLYVSSEAIKKADPELADSLRSVFRSDIERIHNVDMQAIDKDLQWLEQDPELMTRIHKIVRDSLQARESRINLMKYD